MKILIIGEYSGFAKNLKNGLEQLGHEAMVFHEGDGWKKINLGDNSFSFPLTNFIFTGINIRGSWRVKKIYYYFRFKKKISEYKKYFDGVLIINPHFIRKKGELAPRFSLNDLKYIIKNNAKVFLSACGDDYVYVKFKPKFRYRDLNKTLEKYFLAKKRVYHFEQLLQNIDGVIPVMCDYAIPYRDYASKKNINVLETIPLPICSKQLEYCNEIRNKIVIFHGINRESKGTEIIIEALNYIKEKYSDKVEVIIDGHLPLEDYLKLIKRVNIVIDQTYSYAYGMNALYSMALGKTVLSGNEPESSIEFGVEEIPVINILPVVDDIIEKLEILIRNPNKIIETGKKASDFVETVHEAKIIAGKYVEVFNN